MSNVDLSIKANAGTQKGFCQLCVPACAFSGLIFHHQKLPGLVAALIR